MQLTSLSTRLHYNGQWAAGLLLYTAAMQGCGVVWRGVIALCGSVWQCSEAHCPVHPIGWRCTKETQCPLPLVVRHCTEGYPLPITAYSV